MRKLLIGLLVGAVVLGGLAGCFTFGRGHGPVDAFQFLASRNAGLDRNVTGVMNEQADPVEILMVIPPDTASLNLVATFSLNTEAAISVVSSGRPVAQQNGVTRNDFSAPVLYSVQVPGEKQPWRYRVTVRYADANAALSQISLPEGYALSPSFSPRVKSYTVEVPYSVRKVRIDAKGQSQYLKDIAIDGAGSGGPAASATVDFSSGLSRRVSIETLAEDGVTQDAYVVTLRRLPADSNAKLESLELVDVPLFPAFSSTRTSYTAEVPYDATQVVVKAKAQSPSATVELLTLAVVGRISSGRTALAARGSPTDRAGAVVDFSGGTLLPLIVAVTAEDGSVQEYLVQVARAEPDHNNALAELAVAGGRMSPAFSPRTLMYAVQVPYSTRQLLVTARTQSALATMELVPGPVAAGTASRALQVRGDLSVKSGATVEFPTAERIVLAVTVTAQDGTTAQYVLDVRRAPPDGNADLGSLSASAGVLSPIFSPRVISYVVSLSSGIESVKLTASAASAVATVEVEGGTASPAATQTFTVAVAAGATETVNLIVTAEDGTQKLYRVRVSREASGPGSGKDANARLSRLQLAGAPLTPAFDPDVLDYEARMASNVSSVILTAAAESAAATIEVDGQPLGRTGRVIAVEPGATRTVIIDVTAGNGNVERTILWLSRERYGTGKDQNARLARLQVFGAQLTPAFDPLVLDYEARMAANVSSVTLTATAESAAATIEVDGQPLARTGRVFALEPGAEKMVIIDVTAENGTISSTVLWLSRERSGTGKDTNTKLERLHLIGAELYPDFDPRVLDYQARLAGDVDTIVLFATAESPVASIKVDGQALSRNGRVIALEPGAAKTVVIDVTAESGAVARTVLRLSREAALDTNTRLSRLQITGAPLYPGFDPREYEYEAKLAANVSSVTLTATAESAKATIKVDGQLLARTGRVIVLEPGSVKTVRIDVTAESGAVARTVLRLSREAAQDSNTRLSRLQLVGAQLYPDFDPRGYEYEAELAANVSSVTLTATAESARATIDVDGQPLARTGRVFTLQPGASKTVIIDVTAESGAVARTVLRLSRGAAQDANTRLSRLQLVGAQLSPDFDPRVLGYQAKLAANVDSVILTAAAESARATIEVDGQPLARTGRVIALEPGASKTVVIDVTAESGAVARTVLRLSREAAQDANARLSRLQLVGAQLSPDFDPRVIDYQAKLAANVASVTLTATAESARATIEVDGQPLARTGRVIALEPGASKTVVIDVTAEAGNVSRTVLRLSRDGSVTPPPTGGDRVSVTLGGVKIGSRELASIASSRGSIGEEARITVRYYRTNTVIVQGTAPVSTKMQGSTPVLTAQWTSPGVRMDQGRLVEVEVAIPVGTSYWLHYTEAQWAASTVAVDVPFLLFARSSRVTWPALGTPVSVTGYVSFGPGGPRKSEPQADTSGLELDAKGLYGVQVTITDPSTGRVLGRDTVWAKPGLPRGQVFTFTRPMSLPEGATVKYTLTAKAKNGKSWTASGTTQIWTTNLANEGGFEPVILNIEEDLAPPK